MKRVAVIIKHPFRECDYRVDLYDCPDDADRQSMVNHIQAKMLGPFEVVALTERVSDPMVYQPPALDAVQVLKEAVARGEWCGELEKMALTAIQKAEADSIKSGGKTL